MAGGAVTDLDHILALGLEREVLVEGGDRVGLGLGDADLLGHIAQQLGGQVAVLGLNVLHDGDEGTGLPDIPGDDLIRFDIIGSVQHNWYYLLHKLVLLT